jgi:formylglycine-generating enzyme required for sulfatase activity
MTTAAPAGCARCGTILDAAFRFCPECGLPVSGGEVLSTEIADVRRRAENETGAGTAPGWRRYLLPTAAMAMFAFVVGTGLVLFNSSLTNRLFPPPVDERVVAAKASWEPEWITIPEGTFEFGEPADKPRFAEVPYTFQISRREITNSLWFDYLTQERKAIVAAGFWQEAFPNVDGWRIDAQGNVELADDHRRYPVRNISPRAIAEFCVWLTKGLKGIGQPGYEIRMPTRLEWEYAARGRTARIHTWGDEDVLVPIPGVGAKPRPRAGIGSPAPLMVDDPQLMEYDSSAFKVIAMGTNVSEWTVLPSFESDLEPLREMTDYLPVAKLCQAIREKSINIQVAWRGASYSSEVPQLLGDHLLDDNASRVFKVWRYVDSEQTATMRDVGIRLVKVRVAKTR